MLNYNDIQIPDAKYKITPSTISKFFEYPSVWYKEQILKEPSDFKGNTSTVLGSACHYIYEQFAKKEPIDKATLNETIVKLALENPNVEESVVLNTYPVIAETVVNEYLNKPNNMPDKVEFQMKLELLQGIYLAGTCDNITGTTIVDYKTVSKKPDEIEIPFNYKIQLLAYAYMAKHNGVCIPDRIRLVYGVRPTKTLPARCIVVTNLITDEDWELIENTLDLIAETIDYGERHPEAIYLLYKSMKLKEENNGC